MFADLNYFLSSGSHTGENLRHQLESILATYDIDDKLVRIVTDNASNNMKAFGDLIVPGFEVYFEPEEADEEGSSEEDELQPDDQNNASDAEEHEERLRIPCFAHTLHLTVNDGLKQCSTLKSSITKVASIAKLR